MLAAVDALWVSTKFPRDTLPNALSKFLPNAVSFPFLNILANSSEVAPRAMLISSVPAPALRRELAKPPNPAEDFFPNFVIAFIASVRLFGSFTV